MRQQPTAHVLLRLGMEALVASPTLLIVDDNPRLRTLLRAMLSAGGISGLEEAAHGEQALALLRRRQIDLVLLDWEMDVLGGLDFVHAVRTGQAAVDRRLPIVMLTAHTEASKVTAARDAGVSGFLRKPVDAKLLFLRIEAALSDRRTFVKLEDFFGPDRRRGVAPHYRGPYRRCDDAPATADFVDL
jgi:CheY-like chemotaxis protein